MSATQLTRTGWLVLVGGLAFCPPAPADAPPPLWQIGVTDHSAAEFALAPAGYHRFLERFGKAENAYYPGLSRADTQWPYVLPGPLDEWAGSGHGGRWDQMNTLPVGFVLDDAPAAGACALIVDLCDTHAESPPTLRITINETIFERELPAGGSDDSITGGPEAGKPFSLRLEFPCGLLRRGYNEIALRNVRGSWLVFDALRLEAPAGARLAVPAGTVIRSVAAAPYAVSAGRSMPATVRVEVFHAGPPGTLQMEIGQSAPEEIVLTPGVQVLEAPARASSGGEPTPIRLRIGGRVLADTALVLTSSPPVTPADYVNVFNGTSHSRWMIAPGPWMPFGMVKLAPDNQTEGWCAGYDYKLEHIDCFSHIHEWTMAGLGMMPTTGPLRTQPGLDEAGYSSRFDKSSERGGIGFYDVLLQDTGIRVEMTATTRAALQRYTFPASSQARVLFDFLLPNEYGMQVLGATLRQTGPARIEGVVQTDLPELYYNGDQRFDLHFVAEFSRPFDVLGGWEDGKIVPDGKELQLAGDCGAFVEFATRAGETVLVRTGLSLVSAANARQNLARELAEPFGWDFAAVVQNQRQTWNELFRRVEIETPDAREKTRFYTNFYRALVGRNTWSDLNGDWMDPDERRQTLRDPNAVMLGCDAFWNTFWNLNQVMNLVAPDWSARWVNSELALYDNCGWLSKGPAGLEYISVMVAEHEIPLLVAAVQAGVQGLDADKILEAAVKMQTTLPQPYPGGGWVGNENLENYLRHGFVATDGGVVGQGAKAEWRRALASNTYEYSYDDWCVAQLAAALGRDEVAATFARRAHSWRNVFDPDTGFARPRLANRDWVTPFDPYRTPGFVEGNAWQYTWFVPHDVPGLVEAMGRNRFLERLNQAFEKSAPTRFNAAGERMDQFPINQGNQPTMHAGWLFNWAGEPWMTQKWIRAILDAYYGFNPADAYLGDEDQGQMSAWFVMSSMGLFQTDGGCRTDPIYELGSPLYPKIVLHLSEEHFGGNTFTIESRNASPTNRFIQSAALNGQPLNQWWIRQRDVVMGGRLVLELGPTPNPEWARGCAMPPVPGSAQSQTLSRASLLDKIRGGWAGQMIGVAYGAPTEFRSNAAIGDWDLQWQDGMLENAIHQDDLYVEMTFAKVMDDLGLDATCQDYGEAFKGTQYHLWHANAGARRVLNLGVPAPQSGHPSHNFHANDIDFQIEADFIGLMCPGLPRESNRYCDRVGRVMNYGDGLYGGMFVCGMYAAGFVESDPRTVVERGLACIPAQSEYAQLIRDVLAWSAQSPGDWRTVWQRIETKWDVNDACPDGFQAPFNIDAKLNGAYIALGLLFGNGDFGKTLEIATRCGQDSDCNPSSAAGVLGVMVGFERIPSEFTGGLPDLADRRFDFTDYSFNEIVRSTELRALQNIERAGGRAGGVDVVIRVQEPEAPPLEQWSPGIPDRRIGHSDPAWQWAGAWTNERDLNLAEGAGSEATLTFHGVAVVVIGRLNQQGGRARVFLDGQPQPSGLDAFIVPNTHDNVLWQTYGLPPGEHVLRIVTTDLADARSQGRQIAIRQAVVYRAAEPSSHSGNDATAIQARP